MKKRTKIGMDVDGVIADFSSTYLTLAREMFGKPEEDYVQQSWNPYKDESSGLTRENDSEIWNRIRSSEKNFWLNLRPLGGTSKLRELDLDRFEPWFITSRVETVGMPAQIQTIKWLQSRFGISYPQVIVVEHASDKDRILSAMQIPFYLDDKIDTAKSVRDYIATESWLKTASYNINFTFGRRVKDLNEYLTYIGG